MEFSQSLIDLQNLAPSLIDHPQLSLIQRAIAVLFRMGEEEISRLDWKILTHTLEDLEKGFQGFYPYRHVRKVTIFGSARIAPENPEYQLAVQFARKLVEQGFMILTGAGGGIMQAGNEGAGRNASFGLDIRLPFEHTVNPYIDNDSKLIDFKYFFTRKLFFLRESDAIALFPGGFGTQDEAMETLTLCQTGKYGPVPLVLIDEPNGQYWTNWERYVKDNLLKRGLISEADLSLYRITDNLEEACAIISNFYCVYHSSRYVGDTFVMRLNGELNDQIVADLNAEYADMLLAGEIEKSVALEGERYDSTVALPRLIFKLNCQCYGRLYQLINTINQLGACFIPVKHPERK